MNLPPYYGAITASILGYLVAIVLCFITLHSHYKIHFEDFLKNFFDIICGSLLMVVGLLLLKLFIPISSDIRIVNLFILLVYVLMGMIFYFIYGYFTHLTSKVFGKDIFRTVKKILLKR